METQTKAKTKEKKTAKPKAAKKASPKKEGVIQHKEFTILKKRSGRYEVLGANGKNVNGDAKAKILVEADLVKVLKAKAKTEAKTEA